MNKRLIASVVGCACLTMATAAEARTFTMDPGISFSSRSAAAVIRPTALP